MRRSGWYLVAYDIADPRRLRKVHHRMKKSGISAQKSVFFVNGDEERVNRVLDTIASVMNAEEDDLRAYPITRPGEVWTNGPNPLADFPLIDLESGGKKKEKKDGKKRKKIKDKKRRKQTKNEKNKSNKRSVWKKLLGLK